MAGGWRGLPEVPADGTVWPLSVAADVLGMPESDLRDLVRIAGLKPAGTIKMAEFRRSGRHPRAYDAARLVALYDGIRKLAAELDSLPGG